MLCLLPPGQCTLGFMRSQVGSGPHTELMLPMWDEGMDQAQLLGGGQTPSQGPFGFRLS